MTSIMLLLPLLAAGPAAAPTCVGEPRSHIQKGHDLSDGGDEASALLEFKCARTLEDSAEALAQIALAEMALGLWVDAETDLQVALGRMRDRWIVQHHDPLAAALEQIRDNVGELMIAGTPAGAELVVDGRSVGKLPLKKPLRLPTGRIELELRAEGYSSIYRERRIEPRVLAQETIDLVPLTPAGGQTSPIEGRGGASSQPATLLVTNKPEPAPQRAARGARWAAWTTLVGGAALLVGGAVFFVLREVRADEFNGRSDCGTGKPNLGGSTCVDLSNSVNLDEKLAITGFAGAGFLGAASLYLFLSSPKDAESPSRHAFSCGIGMRSRAVACALRF